MGNVIDSTGQMIDKINDILKTKKDAVIKIGGNVILIDDDFMIQGSSSLEVSSKQNKNSFRNINFDTMLSGTMDKDQILSALNVFKQIWFNEQVSSDYKGTYKDSFLNEMFNYKVMFHTDLPL